MWQDLSGQPQAVALLRKAIARGRVAHAYLFAGPRGAGKTKAAVQLAKSLLCEGAVEGDSCEQCSNCRRIEHGNHPDVRMIEPDGASVKLEQIRELRKEFHYRGAESPRRIYIFSGVEKMTREAANSLLIFLEEPWENVTLVLIASNLHGVLPTLISRCQVVSFHGPSWPEVAAKAVGEGIPPGDARVGAQIAGNLERVKELCQQEAFAQLRKMVIKFYQDLGQRKTEAFLQVSEQFLTNSQFREQTDLFLDLLLVWWRDLMQVLLRKEDQVANVEHLDLLTELAGKATLPSLARQMEQIHHVRNRLKWMNAQLALEQLIFRL